MEKEIKLDREQASDYIYHDPCHSPMKRHNPLKVTSKLMGREVILSDRCCGEAGTLGTARPDIANQLRYRKAEELHSNIGQSREANGDQRKLKLLTSCPACQQGLAKYQQETGLETGYIVVELAEQLMGKQWQNRFIEEVKAGGIERVLL